MGSPKNKAARGKKKLEPPRHVFTLGHLSHGNHSWPCFAVAAIVASTIVLLRFQGRQWWCDCGTAVLWWSDTHSSHNSQHLGDPYSFTHVVHGILMGALLAWCARRWQVGWQFSVAMIVEALWEVVENTSFVINRYRTATMALGYEGDSIANSVGDIVSFAIGFMIARRVSLRAGVVIVLASELLLLVWIRDSLLLNVIMLIYPLDAIKEWQLPK